MIANHSKKQYKMKTRKNFSLKQVKMVQIKKKYPKRNLGVVYEIICANDSGKIYEKKNGCFICKGIFTTAKGR